MVVTATPFRVDFVPRVHIQREAESLLLAYQNQAGITLSPPVPVEAILEQHLGLTLEFDELLSPDGEQDILAATFMTDGIVTIQSSLAPENGGILSRYRYTLAHEIGHWVQHRKYFLTPQNQESLFTSAAQPDIVCRSGLMYDPAEVQANAFAAELLMPRGLLTEFIRSEFGPSGINEFAVEYLACRFEVSKQAAGIRLDELGLLRKDQNQNALPF